jgi:50S ribosomal protein L16 3-hydroxylase
MNTLPIEGLPIESLPIETVATHDQPLGMPPAHFLRDYWQKRPLLIRNAFANFEAPLTPEDLAGLACEEAALSRLVRHDRASDRWELRSGPFDEDDFPGLPREDWTLLVQDVDKWDVDVAALLARFDFLPRWRIDDVMVSFAAPGGSVGAHVDHYDVFLLQGLGRRRWQIDARANPPTAFRDDVELKLLREFSPSHDWVLEAGDMLYLPPGVPHHGVAVDACLTFSIGMRAPAASELMVDFAEFVAERMPEEARYSDPDLVVPKEPGEIDEEAIRRVLGVMPWVRVSAGLGDQDRERAEGEYDGIGCSGEVSSDGGDQNRERAEFEYDGIGCSGGVPSSLLRTWFGRFITRYRSAGDIAAPPTTPALQTINSRLQAGAALVRHPFCRVAWMRDGADRAQLFVDGEVFPASLAAARCISAPAPIAATAWNTLDAADRALLHDLISRGSYALSRPARKSAK